METYLENVPSNTKDAKQSALYENTALDEMVSDAFGNDSSERANQHPHSDDQEVEIVRGEDLASNLNQGGLIDQIAYLMASNPTEDISQEIRDALGLERTSTLSR